MWRGDIWHVDLDPIAGSEQAGRRYVLIVSADNFNESIGRAVICPITSRGRLSKVRGFTVSLEGAGTATEGLVICDQLRILDLKARHGRFRERVPDTLMDQVLARILPIFER